MATRKSEYKDGDFACIRAADLEPYLRELRDYFEGSVAQEKAQRLGKYLLKNATAVRDVLAIPVDTTNSVAEDMFQDQFDRNPVSYKKLKEILRKIQRNDLDGKLTRYMKDKRKEDDDVVELNVFMKEVADKLYPKDLSSLGIQLFGETITHTKIQHDIHTPKKAEPYSLILEAWMKDRPNDTADELMGGVELLRVATVTNNVYKLLLKIKEDAVATTSAIETDQTDSPLLPDPPRHKPGAPGDHLPELRQELEDIKPFKECSDMYS